MMENALIDGSSLEVEHAVHRETAPDVAKIAVYGDANLPYFGIIYRRWVNKEGAEHYGCSYIGETPNEKVRQQSWNKKNLTGYAGKKLLAAREQYPLEDWDYEVLERVFAQTEEELKALLHERETYYIAKYDSFDNGFNGNRGGSGNKGVKFDAARCKQNGDNRRGKPQPKESVGRMAAKNRGRKHTDEAKLKISKANKGKKRTAQQKAAQSAIRKGKVPVAACEGAKKWREENPGGWWATHEITAEMKANMKAAQQARGIRIKATLEDGRIICFPTMLDTANHFGMGAGSISNFVKSGNFSEQAKAKFEKISDAEYQQWKSQNP